MTFISNNAIDAQMFIYALDPNHHLLADAPFPEFLSHLVRISARTEGLPVLEAGILHARALAGSNPFWNDIANELLTGVQHAHPACPIELPKDPEEVWRKKLFTYPPGRYAILRCGGELASLTAKSTTNLTSALPRKRKLFQASKNPWDRAVARAIMDFKPLHRSFHMGLKTWIRREEIRAKDGARSALQIAMAAARFVRESKPTNRQKRT